MESTFLYVGKFIDKTRSGALPERGKSKQKVECDFPFYGRWQYDALGSAGSIGGTLCLFLRLRDRIFFPEPDTPEKPR